MSSDYPPPSFTTPSFPGSPDFGSPGFQTPGPGVPRNRRRQFFPMRIVVLVMVATFGAGIVGFVFGTMKSNELYRHTLQVATNDTRVQAKLGAPVTPGWLVTGKINTSGSSGTAQLAIPLRGSAHKGTVYVVASKSAGQWSYQTMDFIVDGENGKLDLLAASNAGTPVPGTQSPAQPAQKARRKQPPLPRPFMALLIIGVITLYIAGVISLVFRFMKASEPYRHA